MAPRTVAKVILEQLHSLGVEFIFGVTGDAIFGFLDELSKQNNITFILARHESAAGFMASTYAKLTGKIGVCVATSGPGMANLLNGLGDAYADHVPVLAITGQVPTHKIGTHYKQYIDQQRFIEPLASFSAQLSSPKALIPLLDRAIQTAIKQKTVTHLSVPKDLFLQAYTENIVPPNPFLYKQPPSDFHSIPQAAKFLNQCKRPVILAGRGALGCRAEIELLSEKVGAGVILSLGAKGIISEEFKYMLGGIGEGGSDQATSLMQECDGLLIIGAMWYPKTFLSSTIPFVQIELEADHIQFNKNLVTALLGDAKELLEPLIEQVQNIPRDPWRERILQCKKEWQEQAQQEANHAEIPIHPAFIMKTLSKHCNNDAVISVDTGDHTVWFNRSFSMKRQDLVFSGTWRTLGYGLPAGVAAQLLYPDRQVIVIAGDGGFMMNVGELSTIKMYNLPIKIVLLNNQCLSMEKNKMTYMGLNPFATELTNPNYAELAHSFGIEGIRIEMPQKLETVISKALGSKGPALIEIMSSTLPTPLSKVQAVSSAFN